MAITGAIQGVPSPPRLWEPPSAEVAALIRLGVQSTLDSPAEMIAALDEASLAANRELLELEPRLADSVRAATRFNLAYWATANVRDPGMPVPPAVGPENMSLARDVVRHGFDETIVTGFRASQNAAVLLWTELAFDLTSDPALLRELLSAVTRSVFAYVDDTVAEIFEMIRRERSQLTDATHTARLEVVSLILEGAPIPTRRASERLRYDLERQHLAGVVWSDVEVQATHLEAAANAVARSAGAQRPLSLPASASTLWIWICATREIDMPTLRSELAAMGEVRVALGRSAAGLDGFRSSHLEAVATQRLMRRVPSEVAVTRYEDIEVVALAAQDDQRAHDFAARVLGPLATASPELRETLRVFLREECSIARTARALFAHRNTVMSRLDRARGLLPLPLDGRTLQVGLALEILHVLGPSRR